MPIDRKIGLVGAGLAQMQALLCLDDVHLILNDAAALNVLHHLIASTPSQMVLVSREDLPLADVVSLRISGLTPEETTTLVTQISALPPRLTERLWHKTGGSPMLLRMAAGQVSYAAPMHSALADAEKLVAHLENHPQVEKYLLDAVLRNLPFGAARLASVLSIFRQPIDLFDEALVELIQQAEGAFDYRHAVVELQQRHLIEQASRAVLHPLLQAHFAHALAANPARRRRFQRIAAEWSEAQGAQIEAAYHYFQAGRLAHAVDILSEQSEALFNRGQAAPAVEVIESMLRQSRPNKIKSDLYRRLLLAHGDLLALTRRAQEAETDYRQALALAGQENAAPAVRADMMRRLANHLARRGQRAEALQMVLTAWGFTTPGDLLLRARLAIDATNCTILLANIEDGEHWADIALHLVEESEGIAPRLAAELRARLYSSMGSICRHHGDFAAALAYWRRSADLARQTNLAQLEIASLGNVGGVLFDQGQIEESLLARNQAIKNAFELGDCFAAETFLTHVATNYRMLGDYPTALDRLAQAGELAEQMNDAEGLALVENQRATVLLGLGRLDEAHELIVRLVHETQAWLGERMRCYFLNKLATTQILYGQFAQAQATLQTALEISAAKKERSVQLQLQITLAVALLAEGQPERAARLLEKSPVDVPLWMELERQLVNALSILACGNPQEARRIAAGVRERASGCGLLLYVEHARRVLQAIDQPPLPAELPKLLWC